jgi:hypothetical protein
LWQNPQEEDEEEEDERRRERTMREAKERPRFLLDFVFQHKSRLPCINVTSGSFPTYQAIKVFFF